MLHPKKNQWRVDSGHGTQDTCPCSWDCRSVISEAARAIFCTLLELTLSEHCVAILLVNSKQLDRDAMTSTVMVRFVHSFFDGLMTMTI